jgi:hypothetical protein
MTLFFINAPTQIMHQALPLIKERQFKDLTVVVPDGLQSTFKKLNIKTIVPKVHPNLITKGNKWHLISNIALANKEYNRYFKDLKGQEIYLFFTSWAVVFMSYVSKLSKHNKVILLRMEEDDRDVIPEYKGLTAFAMKLIAKWFLKVDTKVLCKHTAKTPAYELNRESIPMEIIVYDKFDEEMPDVFIDDEVLAGKSILFLSSKLESEGADMQDIEKITNYLYDILETNYPKSYVIKGHPRDGIIYAKMKDSKHILSHQILMETLLNHDWKFIISYYSEALMSAKIRTNANVISLLHLWKWADQERKEGVIQRHNRVGVLMPKTKEELKRLLVDS